MKRKILFVLIVFLGIGIVYILNKQDETTQKRLAYVEYINNHPYSKRKLLTKEELKKIPKKDRPDLAFEQDFLRTMDPATRTVPKGRLIQAIKTANELSATNTNRNTTFNWESRGPLKVSGRTRAVIFDPNDNTDKKVFAGGVSGGIWVNNDITDENSPWAQVAPNMTNFAVSAMAYDPNNTMIFYAGTGEGWGNLDAVRGGGMWKSVDGGTTWSNLSSTTNYDYIFDIVVRDESGTSVIYAAMRDLEGLSSNGTDLFRSVDGGASWTVASNEEMRDLELDADNNLWGGDGTGSVHYSSNGTDWSTKYTTSLSNPRRVEIANAPSSASVVYAIVSHAVGNAIPVGEIVKSTDGGNNWVAVNEPSDSNDDTIPNDDFSRTAAWYNLIATVHPTNSDEVYIGAVNTFKTTDGGLNWSKISSWEDFYDATVSFVHADIHNIIFRPNHNDQKIIATDGGIFYVPDLSVLPTSGPNAYTTGIFARNLNFNITQFYSAAIDPVNTNGFLGGTQDNGTNLFFEAGISNTNEIWGGDGGFCFIDQTINDGTNGLYRIVSFTGNTYYLLDYTSGSEVWIQLNSGGAGSFINPADYDDTNNILYSYDAVGVITETTLNADNVDQGAGDGVTSGVGFLGTSQNLSIPEITSEVSHIRVSPYNETNRAVFFGTLGNKLIKRTADGNVTDISNNGVISGSISCLEIGATDDELLLTYTNYGVKSVWYSIDGGTTWLDKEGNLPDMPVRWALFNPLDRKEVLIATEVGMWRTLDITATTVVWEPVSANMGNVRVDMLQYRESDNLVLAATHGRGMFTDKFTATPASVNQVLADEKVFTMYPTISKGDFTLYAKNTLGKSTLNIYDISGKQVYTRSVDFNSNNNQQISVNLRPGVYIVNLIDENKKKSSGKIIIE
ncbi:MAG: T9SS type A sorting domain-containing protein [Flavobacteriaceae bacterium]